MRVWVTRDERDDGPLCTALQHAGLTPVLEPVLMRRVISDCALLIGQLSAEDWLVLTSPFAVRAVAEEQSRKPNVAVVGESSRAAAEERGFRVELVAAEGTGEALFAELRKRVRSGKVCYPRSSLAEPVKPWEHVDLQSPVLYETVPRVFDPNVARQAHIVSVASPSAVEVVGKVDLPYASIGPITTKALRTLGIKPVVEAPKRNFAALSAAIADYAKRIVSGAASA